jgi:hypothetical protein
MKRGVVRSRNPHSRCRGYSGSAIGMGLHVSVGHAAARTINAALFDIKPS